MRVREGQPGPVLLRLASTVDGVRTIGSRARRAVRGWALAGRFAARGDNVVFDPDGVYSFATIELGSNVDLGYRPTLIAARGGSGSATTSCSARRSPSGAATTGRTRSACP